MAAITGVHHMHMGGNVLGNQVGAPGLAVAHHKGPSAAMADRVINGVEQAFALGGRTAGKCRG